MDDKLIASRLVNYADALVGLTVVGVSGLAIALMDPPSRCSLSSAIIPVALGSSIFAVIVVTLLAILRRWEMDLLEGTAISKKAESYSLRLHIARLVLVGVSVTAAIVFLVSAVADPKCIA